MSSPTRRSLALLRAEGWCAEVVERWNQHAGPHGIRQDLFDCMDIVAVHVGGYGVTAIQATSRSNHSKRVAKALTCWQLAVWLSAGNSFEVWSWTKAGKSGRRKTWQVMRQPVLLDEMKVVAQGGP